MLVHAEFSLSAFTYGVHQATVHVGVEQVGHGQHGAVPQRRQPARHATLPAACLSTLIFNFTAVIEEVHKECEIPKGKECTGSQGVRNWK